VITLATVSSGHSELCELLSERGAGVAEKTMERSGARSRRSRSGNGAGSGVTEIGLARSGFFVAPMIRTLVIQYCVYGVVFFMYGTFNTLGAYSSSRICCCALSASVQ